MRGRELVQRAARYGHRQPSCSKDEHQGRGSQLERCNTDLTGWDVVDTCNSATLCTQALESKDATDLVCPAAACAAGEFSCSGSTLRVCNDDLTGWTIVQICPSDVLCTQGLANHLCGNATCSAGSFVCAGNALERCKDDATGYELVDTCGSSDPCNKTLTDGLDAKTIQCDQACTPGKYSCDGKRLLRCKDDGSATELMESCASTALCAEAASSKSSECPAACAAGECRDDELWTCNSDLTDVELEETCSSATMCLPGVHAKCMPVLVDIHQPLTQNPAPGLRPRTLAHRRKTHGKHLH
jgi:hypothetical protein